MLDGYKRATLAVNLMVWFLVLPMHAQLQVGDNVSMKLNGNLSFGYTGDFSNVSGSSHGVNPSGNADLSGFYYSPSFLSFDVQPFYNQSRSNSAVQSVFQSGGVSGSASIFSGSHFPGSVSYSKTYNSEGGFVVPGVGTLTTRGNSDNIALAWGIRVPNYPSVSFRFADGGNTSSIFGTDGNSTFHAKTFGVMASETWAGFNLNGGYQHNAIHSVTPEFLVGEGPQTSHNVSNALDFNLAHKLPFNGSFSVGGDKTDIRADSSAGDTFNGNIDTVRSGVGFQPITNLNVGVNAQYTNNLEGSMFQPVIAGGGIVPAALLNYSTHSLDINSQASYVWPARHITVIANADRRNQSVLGASISADTLAEIVTYGNDLLGGFVTATVGASQTAVSVANSTKSQGFFETASYTRKVQKWSLSGAFNYSHNTQTALVGYTSSGHGYSAGIGRKFGSHSYWSVNAAGTKSTFDVLTGSGTFTQSYSTSLSLNRFSVSGSIGRADGTSILTPTGLTPVSNPLPDLNPLQAIYFNGKFYSIGASTNPVYGLVLSGTYSKTNSSTLAASAFSQNSTAQLNTMLQYKVRKLWITGGYLKLQQGFSITGQPAASYSSFFVGITRWFNFF